MQKLTSPKLTSPSVDEAEIAKFAAMADEWWDINGKFKPLHKFNPVRLKFIRDRLCQKFDKDINGKLPLKGLNILDIGSGGGLLCEPLARMGANITGIDATERSINIAKAHAKAQGLEIEYNFTTAEQLYDTGIKFDAVMNMEVIEHVGDVDGFIAASVGLLKDDGLMFMATLNRTAKSYALAIIGAEYIMGWLPRGTHDWKKFKKPSEIAAYLRKNNMQISELTGVIYNQFMDQWHLDAKDINVNYMLVAQK